MTVKRVGTSGHHFVGSFFSLYVVVVVFFPFFLFSFYTLNDILCAVPASLSVCRGVTVGLMRHFLSFYTFFAFFLCFDLTLLLLCQFLI